MATRSLHSHRALLLGAVLGPALLFAAMAAWSFTTVERASRAEIGRIAEILYEHTAKLLQTNEQVLARVDDRIAGLDAPAIRAREPELHRFLTRLTEEVPELDGLFVADAAGEVLATSRTSPAPSGPAGAAANVRDRRYFAAARQIRGTVVDGPFKGRISGRSIIDVAQRIEGPDGSFRGVVVAVVSIDQVAGFWNGIVQPGDSVTLIRADGVVLARSPPVPVDEKSPVRVGPVLAEALGGNSGFVDGVSAVDGVARTVAFRRIGELPLYVLYGVDRRNMLRPWYPIVAAFGALAAAAAAGLGFTALAVLRRARRESEALARTELAAAALRESEEHLRSLFRSAPVPMHALDAEERIVEANDAWLRTLGYARSEVIGRHITDFHPHDNRPLHDARWRELIATGAVRDAERRYVRKDGEVIETLVSAIVERTPQGEFGRVITAVTDVTARRRAEDAARRAREFSDLLVENATEGIIGIDLEMRYTVWNPYMEQASGLPRDAVVGRRLLSLFPHLEGSPLALAWRAALDGKRSSLREWRYAYPQSGNHGYFDQDFAPLLGADGKIIGAVAFVRDVTERRRMEEALRQSQKMEAVGQLTGGVAHDFNNLLTVIIGNLDLLRQRARPGDIETARLVDAAMRGATRGATLTQRLLAFSRRQPLDARPVDLNALVAGMSELLRRTLGERIEVESRPGPGLWPIEADANQLESAILNLAVNARDAMPGGGRLVIRTRNLVIDPAGLQPEEDGEDGPIGPGHWVVLEVEDTGHGMPESVRGRVFEPFFTTKEVGQGTGLGLSQVYGFVRQSGGHVRITSAPDRGTRVAIFLPRLVAGGGAVTPGADGPDEAQATRRQGGVLLVEDDAEVRGFTAEALRRLGYEVSEAASAREALAALERAAPLPDVLFSDIGLPGGMTGRELAAEARRRWPGLRILLTTGYAREGEKREGLAAEIGVLRKPFTVAALAAQLERVLATPVEG